MSSGIHGALAAWGGQRPGRRWTTGRRAGPLWLTGFLLVQMAASGRAQQPSAPACAKARPFITRAQAAVATGDSARALQELNQAIRVDTQCAQAYLLLGLAEFKSGTTEASIEHYQRALALEPRSYSAHYDLALAYLKEHRLQEARTQLELATNLDPHQADAAYDLGMVLLELNQPSQALTQLRRAKALNPLRPDAAFNTVRALLEAGQVPEARTEAHDSAKRFGSDFRWNVAVGQLFLQKAQAKDAASYLRQASRIHPEDVEIRHQLAIAYLGSGQADEVLSTLGQPRTSDDHYLRASAYYLSRRFEEADQESELALAQAPDNPQILVLRTRLLQRAGEQDEALKMAQKATTLAPNWDEPYYLAGVSYYFIRRYEQAEQSLARALELNPNSARALFLQSIALANLGKIDDAERVLRRAIALEPENGRLHCHLGILLMRRNENAEAEGSFRKAIQLRPDYGLPHYELGKLLVSSKQLRPAAQELEQAVKNDPGLGAAYYQLARVYAKLGETEKSERLLAEFERLYEQEAHDLRAVDQSLDADARKATEAP